MQVRKIMAWRRERESDGGLQLQLWLKTIQTESTCVGTSNALQDVTSFSRGRERETFLLFLSVLSWFSGISISRERYHVVRSSVGTYGELSNCCLRCEFPAACWLDLQDTYL